MISLLIPKEQLLYWETGYTGRLTDVSTKRVTPTMAFSRQEGALYNSAPVLQKLLEWGSQDCSWVIRRKI